MLNICDLPIEVLSLVLLPLSATERSEAKLVCQKWYQACFLNFNSSEKIVCRGFYKLQAVRHILTRYSSKTGLNIEFRDITLTRKFTLILEKIGKNLQSLKLIGCNILPKSLRKIITVCDQLQYLEISQCEGIRENDDFSWCIERNIERTQLRTFKLKFCSHYSPMNTSLFHQVYKIFPNVINITLDLNSIKIVRDVYEKTNCPPSDLVFTYLSACNNLSNGEINEWKQNTLLLSSQLHNIGITKLRISTSEKFSPAMLENKFPSLMSGKNLLLQKLTLMTGSYTGHFMFHVLENCRNLRHLEMTWCTLSGEFHKIFSRSNLYSLKLTYSRFNGSEPLYDPAFTNYKLRRLNLEKSEFSDYIITAVQTYKCLTHLNLANTHLVDATLQLILKCQTNLISLSLENNRTISDFGFSGQTTISDLKSLQNLNIGDCTSITETTIYALKLPYLKCLSLNNCYKISGRSLLRLSGTTPLLEELRLKYLDNISPKFLVKVCKTFPKLRCIHAPMDYIEWQEVLEMLQQSTPTLRWVHYIPQFRVFPDTFFFDYYEKKWTKKRAFSF